MDNPINVNLGECPYCEGHVTYQLTHHDYDGEWEGESKLWCEVPNCILNHFDIFYSEWDDFSCPQESLYPEYLEKRIRSKWREWKADFICQQDLFVEFCKKLLICKKLLKEKPMP